jgi:hypothetical protein
VTTAGIHHRSRRGDPPGAAVGHRAAVCAGQLPAAAPQRHCATAVFGQQLLPGRDLQRPVSFSGTRPLQVNVDNVLRVALSHAQLMVRTETRRYMSLCGTVGQPFHGGAAVAVPVTQPALPGAGRPEGGQVRGGGRLEPGPVLPVECGLSALAVVPRDRRRPAQAGAVRAETAAGVRRGGMSRDAVLFIAEGVDALTLLYSHAVFCS